MLSTSSALPTKVLASPQWIATKGGVCIGPRGAADWNDVANHGKFLAVQERASRLGLDLAYVLRFPEVGFDLDNCVSNGLVHPQAQALVERVDSFTEFSRSGKGLHILALGLIGADERAKQMPWGGELRISRERQFFLTGDWLRSTPLEMVWRSKTTLDLYTELFPAQAPERYTEPQLSKTDTELLSRMPQYAQRLYEGNWQADYPSPSEADVALSAFFGGRGADREQISRLVRSSGLMRVPRGKNKIPGWKKWESSSYRERTLNLALSRVTRGGGCVPNIVLPRRAEDFASLSLPELPFAELPGDVRESFRKVYEALKLRVRWNCQYWNAEPVMLSVRYVQELSGVAKQTANDALSYLRENAYIELVSVRKSRGLYRDAYLYAPGPGPRAARKNRWL